MQASAGFVSASALGMACGPALAGLLQTNFKIWKLTFNEDTLPGWVMAIAWLFYLVWLCISFREPVFPSEETNITAASSSGTLCHFSLYKTRLPLWLIFFSFLTTDPAATQDALENGVKQPLLLASDDNNEAVDDEEGEGSEEAKEDSRAPVNSIKAAYRLLTPSVKVLN